VHVRQQQQAGRIGERLHQKARSRFRGGNHRVRAIDARQHHTAAEAGTWKWLLYLQIAHAAPVAMECWDWRRSVAGCMRRSSWFISPGTRNGDHLTLRFNRCVRGVTGLSCVQTAPS
jgi:hypothetical protein